MPRKHPEPDLSLVSLTAGVRGGAPCVRGTGIGAEFIVARWMAGESVASLADDYTSPPDARFPHVVSEKDIEDTIRFVVWHWRRRLKLPEADIPRFSR